MKFEPQRHGDAKFGFASFFTMVMRSSVFVFARNEAICEVHNEEASEL